jgi:hypothetical protein
MQQKDNAQTPIWPLRFLLLVPIVASLWVSFYNSVEPTFLGIPFFYWYQLAWVPLSGVLTGIVYLCER